MSTLDAAYVYENNSFQQREDGLKLIKLLAPEKGDKVLNLGCGTGYLSKVLADLVGPEGQVIAIDPDTERLKVAKDKYTASNLQYLEGSSDNIPGKEGEYDIVFSNYVVQWIKDKGVLFKNIAQSLKIGGKFAFVTPSYQDFNKEVLTPAEMYSPESRNAIISSLHMLKMDEYKPFFYSSNFEIIYLEEHVREWKLHGVKDLVNFCSATLTHGRFDETHFDVETMKKHHGDGEIVFNPQIFTAILRKM